MKLTLTPGLLLVLSLLAGFSFALGAVYGNWGRGTAGAICDTEAYWLDAGFVSRGIVTEADPRTGEEVVVSTPGYKANTGYKQRLTLDVYTIEDIPEGRAMECGAYVSNGDVGLCFNTEE